MKWFRNRPCFLLCANRDDDLAEVAAESGMSVDTREGEGEGVVAANGPIGGEGGEPLDHSMGGGGKKEKVHDW